MIIDASILYKEEFYEMKYIVRENNSPIDDIIVGESYSFNEIVDYLLDRDLDYKYISIPKPNSSERDDISSDNFIDEILRYIIKIRTFRGLIRYLKKKYRYIVLENEYEKVIIFIS